MKLFLVFIICLLTLPGLEAQDFVDIFKISANNASLGNVSNDEVTNVNNQNLELYYPTRVNENLVILTGFTFENTHLNLFEDNDKSNFLMTRLNLGIK